MALVVEDGTGLTNANAFLSLADAKAYWDERAMAYSPYTDSVLEAAIVRATDFLSDHYVWKGFKLKERNDVDGEQSLAWPRDYVIDRNGYDINAFSVPTEIEKATAELALYEAANPQGLKPIYEPQGGVESMVRVGPITVQYDIQRSAPEGARPVLLAVWDLVWEFVSDGASSDISGLTGRA